MTRPTDAQKTATPPLPPPGRVTRTLIRWLMRPARVAAVETLSPHIRLVDLEGEALKGVAWAIGQKIQVAMGSGLSARTYTPISWDAGRGRTRLITFAHGDGPGSRWASGLGAGATCQFFGPRRSLDLSDIGTPVVLFGDETSFALAAALHHSPYAAGARYLLDVSNVAEAQTVLPAIGLGTATAIGRAADDSHLSAVEAELLRLAAGGTHFVLTGKASSIQRLSRALKTAGVASSRIRAKAHWAPGKVGLD